MRLRFVVSTLMVLVFTGTVVTSLSGQGRGAGTRKFNPRQDLGANQRQETRKDGQQLFERETFGGNGRTCVTCHSRKTGTVSPRDAQARFQANPNDPLFLFDG